MGDRKFRLHDGKRGVALAVRVTPRASRNEVSEIQSDGTVKVRLKTSPGEEDSNKLLIVFLADVLGVKTSQIDIVAGKEGADKLVSVLDMDKDDVVQRLTAYIG